jgi:hypothetical protein
MKTKRHYRQGDVLVIETDSIPKTTTPIPRESGNIVLAHGEVTGHTHAISSFDAAFLAAGAQRFLDVKKTVELRHEEHAQIDIAPGNYEVVIQREYEAGEIRNVED